MLGDRSSFSRGQYRYFPWSCSPRCRTLLSGGSKSLSATCEAWSCPARAGRKDAGKCKWNSIHLVNPALGRHVTAGRDLGEAVNSQERGKRKRNVFMGQTLVDSQRVESPPVTVSQRSIMWHPWVLLMPVLPGRMPSDPGVAEANAPRGRTRTCTLWPVGNTLCCRRGLPRVQELTSLLLVMFERAVRFRRADHGVRSLGKQNGRR